MAVSTELQEIRENMVLDVMSEPMSVRTIAIRTKLSYHAAYRIVQELVKKNLISPLPARDGKKIMFQAGSGRRLPQFRVPTGQIWSLNDFVQLYETNPNFQFESANLTNALPRLFLEVYERAHALNAEEDVDANQPKEWRRYLEQLRLQLNNTLAVVNQSLINGTFWRDDLLKSIVTDPEALSKEIITELNNQVRHTQQEEQNVSTT